MEPPSSFGHRRGRNSGRGPREPVWEAALRRAATGERCPSGAQRFWWKLWPRRAAARDRCASACGQRRSCSGHLGREPARKPGCLVPRPIARRASGALSPMRDASRGSRPRVVQKMSRARACNQTLPQSEPAARLSVRRAARPRLGNDPSIPAARRALPKHRQAARPARQQLQCIALRPPRHRRGWQRCSQ